VLITVLIFGTGVVIMNESPDCENCVYRKSSAYWKDNEAYDNKICASDRKNMLNELKQWAWDNRSIFFKNNAYDPLIKKIESLHFKNVLEK
jgi:hypothetical protein